MHMPGICSLSLVLLALPDALSFLGFGVPGPTFAPPLASRRAHTLPSFAPRRPGAFPGVLGSTGAGSRRFWGGHVLRASDGGKASSKEAPDGAELLTTMGMTGAQIDYESGGGREGRVGSQWVVTLPTKSFILHAKLYTIPPPSSLNPKFLTINTHCRGS